MWSIKQFNGSQEYLMRAHFGLPSISAEDAREWKAPIQVIFMLFCRVLMFHVIFLNEVALSVLVVNA